VVTFIHANFGTALSLAEEEVLSGVWPFQVYPRAPHSHPRHRTERSLSSLACCKSQNKWPPRKFSVARFSKRNNNGPPDQQGKTRRDHLHGSLQNHRPAAISLYVVDPVLSYSLHIDLSSNSPRRAVFLRPGASSLGVQQPGQRAALFLSLSLSLHSSSILHREHFP
jgi:hypothetical protein